MKEYKFKLDALLRLRVFKEKRIKQELGEIVSEIDSIKKSVNNLEKSINYLYECREKAISSDVQAGARILNFYSSAFDLKRKEIKLKKNREREVYKRYDTKMDQLKVAMGDVKLIERVKEDDFKLFKKEKEKKEQKDIEELLQYRIAGEDRQ